jgi:hypothetical protein
VWTWALWRLRRHCPRSNVCQEQGISDGHSTACCGRLEGPTGKKERVLFIGTRFSNLYTAVDTLAKASWFLLALLHRPYFGTLFTLPHYPRRQLRAARGFTGSPTRSSLPLIEWLCASNQQNLSSLTGALMTLHWLRTGM